ANALQPNYGGNTDAFVAKLTADGSALVYSTYLGGGFNDLGGAIAVDAVGNAYVVGSTTSVDFPTANAFQPVLGGNSNPNGFVAKLTADGSALVYSTYLGGSDSLGDGCQDIAVDSAGNAYVTGSTRSRDFPTMNPFQPRLRGRSD